MPSPRIATRRRRRSRSDLGTTVADINNRLKRLRRFALRTVQGTATSEVRRR
jgi:hypothetical protein